MRELRRVDAVWRLGYARASYRHQHRPRGDQNGADAVIEVGGKGSH